MPNQTPPEWSPHNSYVPSVQVQGEDRTINIQLGRLARCKDPQKCPSKGGTKVLDERDEVRLKSNKKVGEGPCPCPCVERQKENSCLSGHCPTVLEIYVLRSFTNSLGSA